MTLDLTAGGAASGDLAGDVLAPSGFDREGRFALGIDFGGTKVALATFNGAGVPLRSRRFSFSGDARAADVVQRALDEATELISQTARTHPGGCACVGVTSPGIVLDDRVLLAPNVEGWQDLALAALVRDGLGIDRVVVGTDVKAAAEAELRWGRLAGHDPAVYVNLGTGVAAAIVVGGRVLSGAHGAAGEIGYSIVDAERADEGVRAGRAPLEERAGGRALAELGRSIGAGGNGSGSGSGTGTGSGGGGGGSAAGLFEAALTDPRAESALHSALAVLAAGVANLAIALDPSRIAVGGGLMASADVVLGRMRAVMAATVPFPPEVVPARFIHDAPLRGAASMALRALT